MKKIILILALGLTFLGIFNAVGQTQNPAEVKTVVVDPVCKMKIKPKAKTTINHEHEKVNYSFCSDVCKKSFLKKPEKYIKK
jgi:YHS domain-containing protein